MGTERRAHFFCSVISDKISVMISCTLHTLKATRLLVLICLLISVSSANASFWCLKSDSSSHLEANLLGQCWTSSSHKDELQCCERSPETQASLSVQRDGCFDSPVFTSVITPSNRMSPPGKVTPTDTDLYAPSFVPLPRAEIAGFTGRTPAQQLPSHQALTALRTVVLRH